MRRPTARLTAGESADLLADREPIFNIPGVITMLAGLMIAIHAVREYLLSPETDEQVQLAFAFIPARFDGSLASSLGVYPGGNAADIWTFVSYAFLHADWTHLGVNVIWLVVFGSALAWRFGVVRTLLLFAVTAAAGAAAHLAAFGTQFVPVVGASAAVSGFTAAALRFIFQPGGPLGPMRLPGRMAYEIPALGLAGMARHPTIMAMIAVWIVLNVLFGAVSLPIPGAEGQQIAWQAHLGGFLAGLLLFPLLDPVRR